MTPLPPSEPLRRRRPGLVAFATGALLAVVAGMGLRAVDAGADPAGAPPVVHLDVLACDGRRTGSGTVVAPGLVVTAAHVVQRSLRIAIVAEGVTVEARVVAVDPVGRDLALVAADGPLGIAGVAPGRPVRPGEGLVAHGHPAGGPPAALPVAAVAIMEASTFHLAGQRVLIVGGALPEGMSGGPVVDRRGALVGVALGTEQASATGVVLPVEEFDDLRRSGAAPAPAVCAPGETGPSRS
jgi:S1-C subfamily serine protease